MPTAVLSPPDLTAPCSPPRKRGSDSVHPMYVSCGLAWEAEELAAVDRLLATPAFAAVKSGGATDVYRRATSIRHRTGR